jgi:hypothetical protein
MSHPLPIHFVWSDGSCSHDLGQLQQALEAKPDQAAEHLEAGHLQHALGEQGYPSLVQDCSKPKHASLLAQRVGVVLALAQRSDAAPEAFSQTVSSSSLFKKGKAELTAPARKTLAKVLGEDKPKAVKKTAKQAAKASTDRIEKPKKAAAKPAKAEAKAASKPKRG